MTKADELWEKYADLQQDQGAGPCTWSMSYAQFLAALKEYGEAVRRQAVGACKELEDKRHGNAHNFACEDCAAAIETMKLP